jgi:hypothetical protein
MKAFNSPSLSIATALLCISANANPAVSLQERQAAQVTTAIIQIFQQIFKGSKLAFPVEPVAWYGIGVRLKPALYSMTDMH